MNVAEMIAQLRIRLEDANDEEFSVATKIDALNNAQDRLVSMLNSKYLTELETLQEWTTETNEPKLTNGIFFLNKLTHSVLNGSVGILAVKVHGAKSDGAKYLNKIDLSQVKEFDSGMVHTDIKDPYYVVFSDRIELVPATTQETIVLDVYYLKKPTEIAVQSDNVYSAQTSELNAGLHYLIVGLAESYLWMNSEEFSRSQEIEKMVLRQIETINSKA